MPEKRLKVKRDKIQVCSKTVRFEEIMSNVVFDLTKLRKLLVQKSISQVSWAAISEHMATKSSDDVRQYWNTKMLPLFLPSAHSWTQD